MDFRLAGPEFAGYHCPVCQHAIEPQDEIALDVDDRGYQVTNRSCYEATSAKYQAGKHDAFCEAWRDVRAHPSKATVMDVLITKARRVYPCQCAPEPLDLDALTAVEAERANREYDDYGVDGL